MAETEFKVYRYRWVVLAVYMAVTALNQLLWITFAAITTRAAEYYAVSNLSIGLLSMSFMIVFILVSIPASWAIDTWGLRVAVGIGAALTGLFGLMRGLVGGSYTLVLVAQIGIAIGQPFILNAVTTVAARWFPLGERATASGLGTLAIYVGIALGLALTPYLAERAGMSGMLLVYGGLATAVAVAFVALARERPPTPPCPAGQEARALVFEGLGHALRNRQFWVLLVVLFIGLGVFNGATTWIEDILRPRGFSSAQAGIAGGLMVVGGVVGALVNPTLSDRARKRVPFIVIALAGCIPGLLGVTFAQGYGLLLASAFVLGFFLLSAGPIAFQYGAEVTYPAPEGTTNGLLILAGQVSGILFILGMDAIKSPSDDSMTTSLVIFAALLLLSLVLCTRLKESALLTQRQG
ncbi:MAG: major facilitator superfamily domain-containing protein 7 [Chloroflexi bacterium]|nr:major facilitator superfamily domain-containing protein 7 [Chloroflexota bacterium]